MPMGKRILDWSYNSLCQRWVHNFGWMAEQQWFHKPWSYRSHRCLSTYDKQRKCLNLWFWYHFYCNLEYCRKWAISSEIHKRLPKTSYSYLGFHRYIAIYIWYRKSYSAIFLHNGCISYRGSHFWVWFTLENRYRRSEFICYLQLWFWFRSWSKCIQDNNRFVRWRLIYMARRRRLILICYKRRLLRLRSNPRSSKFSGGICLLSLW